MGVNMKMMQTVDLNAPLLSQEAKGLLVTGDNNANTIILEVVEGGKPADLTGCSATAYMIREDGQKPFVQGTVEGNIVTVCLNDTFYAMAGRYNLFVRLTHTDGTKCTLLWINGWAKDEGSGEKIDTEGTVPDLDDLLAQIAAMEKATADAKDAAASITEYTQEVKDMRTDVDGRAYVTAGAAAQAHQISRTKLISDDLNNYTEPMWGVVSGSAANAPCNQSGVVINSMSKAGTGWLVQQYFSAYDGQAYWRSLRVGQAWSEWHSYRRTDYSKWISASVDLDTVLEDDFYFAMCDKAAINAPEDATDHGMLLLLPFSSGYNTWYTQMWISADMSGIYSRAYHDEAWTAWGILWRAGSVKPKRNVVFMGDSILGNDQSATGVVNLYAALTGNECHNFAMGGTRTTDNRVGWDEWDALSLCQAIVSGDFSTQYAALDTAANVPGYFQRTLDAMSAYDFSTCDVLVINWGTNDWANGNTYEQYYAALMTFIATMQTAFPQLRIIKMTPTQRFDKISGEVISGNAWTVNGGTLRDFVEQESRITYDTNTPVLDMYNLGINTYNYSNYIHDMTHHNERGRRLIAEKLAREV